MNKKRPGVIPGAEVLLKERLDMIRGSRVGLVTNQTGIDSRNNPLIDLMASHPGVELAALFCPEHGFRGDAQAGEYVPFQVDPTTGLPVFSLYGQRRAGDEETESGCRDEVMRRFDIREEEKAPDGAMLDGLDVMMLDLQDVGTRVYTYAATMSLCMRECAARGIRFLVLDRPNPINGMTMEGPVLDFPRFSSFVGLYPVPLRHGMTMGEMARMFNERFMAGAADLTVIPMRGWRRAMWHDETGLPWVRPSPNLPTLEAVTVYPGQVFWEGTNVSEGRGTEHPFEQCGAPWIRGSGLASVLNSSGLPGVEFRAADFRPAASKFAEQDCSGIRLYITNRTEFRPVSMFLHMAAALRDAYPGKLHFHEEYFDRIMGTDTVRSALESGVPADEIEQGFASGLEDFSGIREPYLLYP